MFHGFEKQMRHVNGVEIAFRMGGRGPALLLLHGHPQTHVIWHKVQMNLPNISPLSPRICADTVTAVNLTTTPSILITPSAPWLPIWQGL